MLVNVSELSGPKDTHDRQEHQTVQVQRIAQGTQAEAMKAGKEQAADTNKLQAWGASQTDPWRYIDLTEMYRTSNMVGDIATNYNAIRYPISPNNDISEFRASARQS